MQHATHTRMPPTKQVRIAGKHASTKATTNTNQQTAHGKRNKNRQQPTSNRTQQRTPQSNTYQHAYLQQTSPHNIALRISARQLYIASPWRIYCTRQTRNAANNEPHQLKAIENISCTTRKNMASNHKQRTASIPKHDRGAFFIKFKQN